MIYIKNAQYSWGDKFFVYEEDGTKKYMVKGSVLLWNRKLEVRDMDKNLLITIKEDPKSLINPLKKKFDIHFEDGREVSVTRAMGLVPKYTIEGLDWQMRGVMTHEYDLLRSGEQVVSFHKGILHHELRYEKAADELTALAMVMTVSYAMNMNEDGTGGTRL